jgi:hypothetical protein
VPKPGLVADAAATHTIRERVLVPEAAATPAIRERVLVAEAAATPAIRESTPRLVEIERSPRTSVPEPEPRLVSTVPRAVQATMPQPVAHADRTPPPPAGPSEPVARPVGDTPPPPATPRAPIARSVGDTPPPPASPRAPIARPAGDTPREPVARPTGDTPREPIARPAGDAPPPPAGPREPVARASAKTTPATTAAERPAPVIRVHIGRVEVRAVTPPSPQQPAAVAPRLSLSEYLERQGRAR